MSLGEFQFIYWWEWGHRQLGRFIGLVYLGGFLVVAGLRLLPWRQTLVLFGMGLLLGLQGTIGWIMVASGLQPGMIAVAPVKLTLHLTFAALFFASVVAFATFLTPPRRAEPAQGRGMAWLLLALLFGQIALGGLVAGSRAGFVYNTWPLMDGALVPGAETLFVRPAFWENFVDNAALVQFNHRLGAYLLLALALWHMVSLRKAAPGSGGAKRATALAGLTLSQAVLGIVTLLLVVPLWAGLAHQALGFLVLAMGVVHVTRTRVPRGGEPRRHSGALRSNEPGTHDRRAPKERRPAAALSAAACGYGFRARAAGAPERLLTKIRPALDPDRRSDPARPPARSTGGSPAGRRRMPSSARR